MTNRAVWAYAFMSICMSALVLGCKKGCLGSCPDFGYVAPLNINVTEVCYNGYCACPSGLEGDSCQTLSYTKYLQPSATWSVSDACSGTSTYSVYMTYDPSYYYKLYINGLFDLATPVEADIVPSSSQQGVNLNIPQQTIGRITFSGQGLYQANGALGRITLTLNYIQSGIQTNCTVQMSQQ